MKTLQELYSEITANDELKKAFAEAAKDNKIVEFAKEHGVETSVDEIKTFLEAQAKNEKELSPEELENAAGGTYNGSTRFEVGLSIFGIGIGCAVYAAYSAGADDMHAGQNTEYDGPLCSYDEEIFQKVDKDYLEYMQNGKRG